MASNYRSAWTYVIHLTVITKFVLQVRLLFGNFLKIMWCDYILRKNVAIWYGEIIRCSSVSAGGASVTLRVMKPLRRSGSPPETRDSDFRYHVCRRTRSEPILPRAWSFCLWLDNPTHTHKSLAQMCCLFRCVRERYLFGKTHSN